MKIKISIEKKYGYVIISLIVLIVISGIVYAYIYPGYTTDINPTPAGHGGVDGVWVTPLGGGNQVPLQTLIDLSYDQGGIKPIKGRFIPTFYNTIPIVNPGAQQDPISLPQLSSTKHHVCMIYSLKMVNDKSEPFTCGVYPSDFVSYQDGLVLDKKRLWYVGRNDNVECKIMCLDWS